MADQQAILKTNQGDITSTCFPNHAPETVANFTGLAHGHQGVRRRHRPHRPVLRRPHLPPGHPRLHDPGRLPARHRHRRPGLHLQGRAPPRAGLRQALPARDGQRRPRHQRLAVLHHRRRDPVAELQAHHLRRGRRPGLARRGRRHRRHPHRRRATARSSRWSSSRSRSSAPEHRAHAPDDPRAGVPTCYRHPDRESYIRCQRCERTICPDCMRDAAVGLPLPDVRRRGREDDPAGAHGVRRPSAPATRRSPRWC